jgi:hypothetical protein
MERYDIRFVIFGEWRNLASGLSSASCNRIIAHGNLIYPHKVFLKVPVK